jgi:hypothetical protein
MGGCIILLLEGALHQESNLGLEGIVMFRSYSPQGKKLAFRRYSLFGKKSAMMACKDHMLLKGFVGPIQILLLEVNAI